MRLILSFLSIPIRLFPFRCTPVHLAHIVGAPPDDDEMHQSINFISDK